MSNVDGASWDEASPALNDPRRGGAAEIRVLREAVRERMLKEHVEPGVLGAGGEHLEGSARTYWRASSAPPTVRPDASTSLGAEDYGRLFVETDTLRLKVFNSASWLDILHPTTNSASRFNQANASPYNIPFTKGSLDAGTWLVFVYGASSTTGNTTVTVNGVSVVLGSNGAGFMIPFLVTVTTQVSVTAVSHNAGIANVQGMAGIRLTLS